MLQTPRMTIAELLSSTDIGFAAVVVRPIEIEEQYGWLYDSCNRCTRKVSKVGSRFYCKNPKCSRMVIAIPRFKVKMRVMDPTGDATFVLFNRVVVDFLGKSAQQISETTEPNAGLPDDFHLFYGKELLFKVAILEGNITQNWQHFAVKRLTADTTVIQSFAEKHLAPAQEDYAFADTLSDLPDIISLIPPNEHAYMLAPTQHSDKPSNVVPPLCHSSPLVTDSVVSGKTADAIPPLPDSTPLVADALVSDKPANPVPHLPHSTPLVAASKRPLELIIFDDKEDLDIPSSSGVKSAKVDDGVGDGVLNPPVGTVVKIEPDT